jgi:hypothetical protein
MALIGEFNVAVKQDTPDREPDQFKFEGELFTVADDINFVALGRFASAANSGMDSAEMEGLAAMIDLISSVVVDEDRDRFLSLASRKRADGELLMQIVQAVIESQTGRPTEQPSGSPDGLSTTGESSKDASSSEASLSPIQRDPRIRELRPITDEALSLLSG